MSGRFWYVYILCSVPDPTRYYVGLTDDLDDRLIRHNSGQMCHTSKFMPWKIRTAIAFDSKPKALAFETYLKSHSGRAFAAKHF